MSEPLDPRPVFIIVMGCDGVGKTAWKRANYDLLPSRYFDQDSFAGGIGDWNSPEAHARTRVYFEAQIAELIDERLDFGIESTYSGQPGPALVERVIKANYPSKGYTSAPTIRRSTSAGSSTACSWAPAKGSNWNASPSAGSAVCPTCTARWSDSTCFGSSTIPSMTNSTCPDLSSNAGWSAEGSFGR